MLNSELLDQLTRLVEKRIRYKDEKIDADLLIETLKDVFPGNQSDVEATIQSFLGSGIEMIRVPEQIVSQASYEARKYFSEREGNWFIYPGTISSFETELAFSLLKNMNKYKLSRRSNSRVDDKCQKQRGFVIARKKIFRPHEVLLEAQKSYGMSEGGTPIVFRVLHQDGINIGKYLAERMMLLWPSHKFEVRVTF